MLTYLATNHPSVASILSNFDSLLHSESSACNTSLDIQKGKTKEPMCDPIDALTLESSQKGDPPLVLFLTLLNRPLFLRSTVHLEQVISSFQIIFNFIIGYSFALCYICFYCSGHGFDASYS